MLQVRNKEAKLCDLRFARKGNIFSEAFDGTMAYMSPEMLSCKEYTRKTDIFSLGICLWELWYGRPVYSKPYHHGPAELIQSVTDGEQPFCDLANAMPQGLQTMLSACWGMDPDKRPAAETIALDIAKVR